VEHPLVNGLDELTPDQLLEKVNELHNKLSIAHRTGNAHLCNQLRMAIESYQTKLREKQQKQYDDSQQNFNDKIKIS
jgi:hypothetical protein